MKDNHKELNKVFNPTPEGMREVAMINKQHSEILAKLAKANLSAEEIALFVNLQFNELIKEIKHQHKQQMEDLFHELMLLANEPQTHLFKKTTYKVELTFSEWSSLRDRYLGN